MRRELTAVVLWMALASVIALAGLSWTASPLGAAGLDAPPPWSDGAGGMPSQAPYNPGPSAPSFPVQASRPNSWPGGAPQAATPPTDGVYRFTSTPDGPPPLAPAGDPGAPAYASPAPPPSGYRQDAGPSRFDPPPPTAADRRSPWAGRAAGSPAAPGQRPIEESNVVERIGDDVILARDVVPGISAMRAQNKGTMPAEEFEKQLNAAIKKQLDQKLETKLIYQQALRKIPADALPKFKESIADEFEKHQLPDLMKRAKADSRAELEEKLKAAGLTLEGQKREFTEQIIAHEWLTQQVKPVEDKDVSHDDMLDYYHTHGAEFDRQARARWEQLTVEIARFPSRAEAYAAIAQMGNDVLRGVPLAQVAKVRSQGPTASAGGQWDWTTQRSLVSKVLDRAIFGLPVGQLSQIIEDEGTLHIVRVIERTEAGRQSFVDAQVKIREKIKKRKNDEQKEKYLAQVKKEIPVWTCFDDAAAEKPAAEPSAADTPFASRSGLFR